MLLFVIHLTKLCSRFLLQVADNLLHDRVNLLVVKRFRLVLQEEADRVRLFALREVLSFIDVEEFDGLEELALAVGSDFPDSVERYCLVDEEGEVALHGRELGDVGEGNFVLLRFLHQRRPREFGVINFPFDVHLLADAVGYDTQGTEQFSRRSLDAQAGRVNIVGKLAEDKLLQVNAKAEEDIFHVSLQLINRRLLVGMRPTVFHPFAVEPQGKVIVFLELSQRFAFLAVLFRIGIAVAEFVETDIGILAFRIVFDALQTAEEECLAHGVEVGTQRVHQHDATVGGIGLELIVISRAGQRVVQDFVKTAARQLFGDEILHRVAVVRRSLVGQTGLHMFAELDVVVAVDAEDIFDDIHVALHIVAVNGDAEGQSFSILLGDFHLEAFRDALNCLYRNHFPDEAVNLLVSQGNSIGIHRIRVNILDGTGDGTASHFLNQTRRVFQDI